MIPKTAISIKLRAIPLSAGLSRAIRKPLQRVVGHHIKPVVRHQPDYQFSVEPDRDLEDEIKRHKEVQHDNMERRP
jgi:hypothetical protein